MKKIRFLAFLCALIMLVSTVSFASAANFPGLRMATVENAMGWNRYRILKNNENVTFLMNSFANDIYEKTKKGWYEQYSDVIFDCEGKVTAKTSTSWIKVEETKPGFILYFESNPTMKTRIGKVTVTGKNYKAVMTFKQNGRDQLVSVSRKKNKVTVKLKTGNASNHHIMIDAYKYEEDGTYMNRTIISEDIKKTTYTFKVEEGWNYQIGVGPLIRTEYGWSMDWTGSCSFTVGSTTGSETYTIYNKSNKVYLK